MGTHRSWQGCNLDLTGVTIDGVMSFTDATFSGGSRRFSGTKFSGSYVIFDSATFSGSNVHFNRTTGPAPAGLLEAVGTPVPTEVRMPLTGFLLCHKNP
ncbi:pentapeptide repeat-containing protein [Streptomyces sp. NPDC056230]|uniref:pentapeptide repeat-containing protein n=1 Tax=Streptomyces sp. NPDC056230 TaxID=3345754 RepID=UPI0035DACF1E